MTQLTEHFSAGPPDNLACRDGCGFGSEPDQYAPGFLEYLETLRMIYGRPIHPTSGARCHARNEAVGGVNLSAHTRAAASDLSVSNGYDRHGLLVAHVLAVAVIQNLMTLKTAIRIAEVLATKAGGFGIAKTFVHCDTDVHLPRPSAWGYPPNTHNT